MHMHDVSTAGTPRGKEPLRWTSGHLFTAAVLDMYWTCPGMLSLERRDAWCAALSSAPMSVGERMLGRVPVSNVGL